MRLTEYQQKVIKETAHKFFGSEAAVFIFGSRTDDTKFGGDIDIYIENTVEMSSSEIFDTKLKMLVELDLKLGEQKIDLVVNEANKNLSIFQHARSTGIRL